MSATAKVYAEALFEVARDRGRVDTIQEEIAELLRAFGEIPGLRDFLLSPRIIGEAKRAVIDEVLKDASPETRNFLKVLVDRGRFGVIGAVGEMFGEMADKEAGRIHVQVTSARALTDEEAGRIMMAVREKTGGNVVLHTSEDRSLMGGVVIRVRDEVLDASVRSRLAAVRRQMLEAPPPDDVWEGDLEETVDDVKTKMHELMDEQDWGAGAIEEAVAAAVGTLKAEEEADGESDGEDASEE